MTHSSLQDRKQAVAELNHAFIACHICDALWQRPPIGQTERAVCERCNTTLLVHKSRSAQRTVALTLAGMILFLVAVAFPFLHMEKAGLSNRISVLDAVGVLWINKMYLLSIASALFILAFPLLQLVVFFSLGLMQLRQYRPTYPHALTLRFTHRIAPWSMAEIFMIGVVVSLVKIGELADIRPGPAFWAMASLMLVLLLTSAVNCRESLWQQIRQAE